MRLQGIADRVRDYFMVLDVEIGTENPIASVKTVEDLVRLREEIRKINPIKRIEAEVVFPGKYQKRLVGDIDYSQGIETFDAWFNARLTSCKVERGVPLLSLAGGSDEEEEHVVQGEYIPFPNFRIVREATFEETLQYNIDFKLFRPFYRIKQKRDNCAIFVGDSNERYLLNRFLIVGKKLDVN